MFSWEIWNVEEAFAYSIAVFFLYQEVNLEHISILIDNSTGASRRILSTMSISSSLDIVVSGFLLEPFAFLVDFSGEEKR